MVRKVERGSAYCPQFYLDKGKLWINAKATDEIRPRGSLNVNICMFKECNSVGVYVCVLARWVVMDVTFQIFPGNEGDGNLTEITLFASDVFVPFS